jgi:hypothetical protein
VFYDSRFVEAARQLGVKSIPVIEIPPAKNGARAFYRLGSRLHPVLSFSEKQFSHDPNLWVVIKIPDCLQAPMENIPVKVLSRTEALGILKPPE